LAAARFAMDDWNAMTIICSRGKKVSEGENGPHYIHHWPRCYYYARRIWLWDLKTIARVFTLYSSTIIAPHLNTIFRRSYRGLMSAAVDR
jgi:hypothetical protein